MHVHSLENILVFLLYLYIINCSQLPNALCTFHRLHRYYTLIIEDQRVKIYRLILLFLLFVYYFSLPYTLSPSSYSLSPIPSISISLYLLLTKNQHIINARSEFFFFIFLPTQVKKWLTLLLSIVTNNLAFWKPHKRDYSFKTIKLTLCVISQIVTEGMKRQVLITWQYRLLLIGWFWSSQHLPTLTATGKGGVNAALTRSNSRENQHNKHSE